VQARETRQQQAQFRNAWSRERSCYRGSLVVLRMAEIALGVQDVTRSIWRGSFKRT
jgi:hypothetical protein